MTRRGAKVSEPRNGTASIRRSGAIRRRSPAPGGIRTGADCAPAQVQPRSGFRHNPRRGPPGISGRGSGWPVRRLEGPSRSMSAAAGACSPSPWRGWAHRVTGLDPAPTNIAVARQLAARVGNRHFDSPREESIRGCNRETGASFDIDTAMASGRAPSATCAPLRRQPCVHPRLEAGRSISSWPTLNRTPALLRRWPLSARNTFWAGCRRAPIKWQENRSRPRETGRPPIRRVALQPEKNDGRRLYNTAADNWSLSA